jgi:chemotaxis response regulator CheB
MGNDGALTAPRMKRQGCCIWTQTPESCANGSMPQSIIDLECSEYSAAPKVLAQALIKRINGLPVATNDQLEAQKNSPNAEPDVQADDQKN